MYTFTNSYATNSDSTTALAPTSPIHIYTCANSHGDHTSNCRTDWQCHVPTYQRWCLDDDAHWYTSRLV